MITPILGSYSLCQLIAAPWWGRLSDRWGRRPILMTSLAGACVSYVILALADNIGWLLVSRVLAGFMAGNISAAFAYASDVSAPEKRAAALGLVGAAIGVGFTLGQPIGGLLAGNDPRTANFVLPAAPWTISMAIKRILDAAAALAVFDQAAPAGSVARRRRAHDGRDVAGLCARAAGRRRPIGERRDVCAHVARSA